MKLPNPTKQVSYGVANGASYWKLTPAKTLKRSASFHAFANERSATSAAKRVIGGQVVRRVVTVEYQFDQ